MISFVILHFLEIPLAVGFIHQSVGLLLLSIHILPFVGGPPNQIRAVILVLCSWSHKLLDIFLIVLKESADWSSRLVGKQVIVSPLDPRLI